MGQIRIVNSRECDKLYDSVGSNLQRYRNGDFMEYFEQHGWFRELSVEYKPELLAGVHCTHTDSREKDNCLALHNAFPELPRALAKDRRMWVWLTHGPLLEYTKTRWAIPADDDQAIKHIQRHFFGNGDRGLERDNSASRLWWMASLCSGLKEISMADALEVLLYRADVRAGIIERPTISLSSGLRGVVLARLKKSYDGDRQLFERASFRPMMKRLSLYGGVTLLEMDDQSSLQRVVDAP